jgi:hypothetical protein
MGTECVAVGYSFQVLKFQRRVLALGGVAAGVGVLTCWYFWPADQGPFARLIAGRKLVSYDAHAKRLTASVNIQNGGDRQTVASIINTVWIDSKKEALSDPNRPQPWRAELGSKQASPVIFVVEGDTAAAVWDGIQLMELTIYATYEGNAKLNCSLSFVGRFYPQLKQVGVVSSVTSPRECRRLR